MIKFSYTEAQVVDICKAAGGSIDPSLLVHLERNCGDFLDRVRGSRTAGADREAKIRRCQEVLAELPLSKEKELALDAQFSRFISSGMPPMKSMANEAIAGRLAWVDFNRYITRREIRQKIEELEVKSPEELDAAYHHKLPRNDLFVAAFKAWAFLKGLDPLIAPISDPVETPAQSFIVAATVPALKLVHEHLGRESDRVYPDGKTVVAAIRAAQRKKKID